MASFVGQTAAIPLPGSLIAKTTQGVKRIPSPNCLLVPYATLAVLIIDCCNLQVIFTAHESLPRGFTGGGPPDVSFSLAAGEGLRGVTIRVGQVIEQLTFFTNQNRTYGPYGFNPASLSVPQPYSRSVYSFFGDLNNKLSALANLGFWTDAVPNSPPPSPPRPPSPPTPPSPPRSPPPPVVRPRTTWLMAHARAAVLRQDS